jgi:two-component system OmpR family response regulator
LTTLAAAARILLVDDDPAIRGVVSDLLEEAGHHLETAASCAAAMDAVTRAPWDLVICDLRLPEGSGATLSQRIIAERPELARRIILLSGEIGALDEGAWPFPLVPKPFNLDDMLRAVETALAA